MLRFALELCAAVAVAFWGFESAGSTGGGVVLALVAGGLVSLVWGAFIAPKAPRRLKDPGRLALELAVFIAAALGIALAGSPLLGVVFPVAVVLNITLMFVLGQRGL